MIWPQTIIIFYQESFGQSQKGLILAKKGLLWQFQGYFEQFLSQRLKDFMNYRQFLSTFIIITYFGLKIPICLLHIGYIGLKCPFFSQEVLIGLKKGLFLPKPASLDNLLFHYKTFFCYKQPFFGPGKSLVVTRRLITPEKVLFETKKHIFEPNSHFFALNNPHWSKKWSFPAKTSL